MSVWGALQARLVGFAGLAALTGTRIYGGHLPQDVPLPAVSYSQVSEEREHAWGADSDLISARFQVDCWGATTATARQVSDQVIAALSRWGGTEDTTVVDQVLLEGRTGPLVELPEETVHRHYRFLCEFVVHYRG